eukprot:Nitzschia sp. Nitz4//scaffold159_size51929//27481//29269//NITZ4_006879-RA/size51929-augustus-gene-0.77-mRNA-1//1//CDS//3329537574//5272//frame0
MTDASLDSFFSIVGNDTSYRHEFLPADAVSSFHVLPRFSHHDDMSALFSDNSHEVDDYALGLLFVACLIMSFFTTWGLLILLFKCIGPRWLGVYSGYPYQHDGWHAKMGRYIFAFSAVVVMTFSLIAVTKGLTQLENTSDTMDATNWDVIKIKEEFVNISANLNAVSAEAIPVRDQVVSFLQNDVCPLAPGSSLEATVRNMGNKTLVALQELDDFISSDIESLDQALRQIDKATAHVDQALEGVHFNTGAVGIIVLLYFVVPSLLLVTLFFGWSETYSEPVYVATTWVLLPLFIVMIMFAYMTCGFAAVASEANADFCSGGVNDSPEDSIANILGRYNLTEGGFYFDTLMFYANQCSTEGPWGFLEDYYRDLSVAQTSLETMADQILLVTSDYLSQECGVEYTPLLQLIIQLQTYTNILKSTSHRTLDLLSCSKIVPLYTNVIYDETCTSTITSSAWVFGCAFVISFFGMLMIMFRGAYYPFYTWDGKEEYSTASDDGVDVEEEDSVEPGEKYLSQRNDRRISLSDIRDMDDDDDTDNDPMIEEMESHEFTNSQYETSTYDTSYLR